MENEIFKNFILKLYSSFYQLNDKLAYYNDIDIPIPNIIISTDLKTIVGRYNSDSNTIELAEELFLNYPFSVISKVFLHELAHLIVIKIWKKKNAKPHGKEFSKACKLLKVEDYATFKPDSLLISSSDKIVMEKVSKILRKAECSATNEKETAIFLEKARELMLKHNLSGEDLKKKDEKHITRPLLKYKRIPSYNSTLAKILSEFYMVRLVITPLYLATDDPEEFEQFYCVELYGEPRNVELAEYIITTLMRKGEEFWHNFKLTVKSYGGSVKGNYTKSSYLKGLFMGYYHKLRDDTEETLTDEQSLVIFKKNQQLEDSLYDEYPGLKIRKVRTKVSNGYRAGIADSDKIDISTPITSEDKGKYLH